MSFNRSRLEIHLSQQKNEPIFRRIVFDWRSAKGDFSEHACFVRQQHSQDKLDTDFEEETSVNGHVVLEDDVVKTNWNTHLEFVIGKALKEACWVPELASFPAFLQVGDDNRDARALI